MSTLLLLLAALCACSCACAAAPPAAFPAGVNAYWLGLDENYPSAGTIAYPSDYRIEDALRTAKNLGARVVRAHTLGISVGNPLSWEPDLDVFFLNASRSIDFALKTAGELGLQVVVPLVDNWHYYHGGRATFTTWLDLPESAFYTAPRCREAFQRYVQRLLGHVNRYTGRAYARDPTVLAWETGNELSPPLEWTAWLAALLKALAPDHWVLDGSRVVNPAAFALPHVDAVSQHFYPMDPAALASVAAAARKGQKRFFAGEFGWNEPRNLSVLDEFLHASSVGGGGDALWSLFPHRDDYGFENHGDGFTVHFLGADAWEEAALCRIRTHLFAMQGVSPPPPFDVPTAPLVTLLRPGSVAWRGATGATAYSVELRRGPGGRWEEICALCTDDFRLPWNSSQIVPGVTLRVRGANPDGVFGAFSPPAHL